MLLARRTLTHLQLHKAYAGAKEVTGAYYNPESEPRAEERRPFKAILDAGLARTTTGARMFGVLKGAVDGGMNVPHGIKRFPGYKKKEEKLDGALHRERIFGVHVAKYMKRLSKEDPVKYKQLFSQYIVKKITPNAIEDLYKAAHAAIRTNPMKKVETKPKQKSAEYKPKSYRKRPRTLKERKNIVRQKIQSLKKRLSARAKKAKK